MNSTLYYRDCTDVLLQFRYTTVVYRYIVYTIAVHYSSIAEL